MGENGVNPGIHIHPCSTLWILHLPLLLVFMPLPPQCRSWLLRAQAVPSRTPKSRASQPQPFIFGVTGSLHLDSCGNRTQCEEICFPWPATLHPKAFQGLSVTDSIIQEQAGQGTNARGTGVPWDSGVRGWELRTQDWDSETLSSTGDGLVINILALDLRPHRAMQ